MTETKERKQNMLKIGNKEFEKLVGMAPLAGITDSSFRKIIKERGCQFSFTEMVSAKGIYYKDPKTEELLHIDPEEGLVGAQIFGRDPEILSKVIKENLNHREDIFSIDLNMCCPAPKVVKNGDGSALMKEPETAERIINAMVESSTKPVSVKFRLGWDEENINFLEIGKICEKAGVSFVTLHPRTRKAFYAGKADWDSIRMLKEELNIPVMGNGDLFSKEDIEKMFRHTLCDGVFVGRGALQNPNIFGEGESLSLQKIVELIKKHYSLKIAQKGERRAIPEMRKHIAWYLKGVPNSNPLKNKINTENNLQTIFRLLEEFEREQE